MTVEAVTSIKLAYAFTSNPNPIRASAHGASANRVDVQVIVSNPSLSSMNVGQVQIEIPVGAETDRALSTSRDLPQPSYDRTAPWTITSTGSTVTIRPRSGASQVMTAPIVFTLPGIQVNYTPGTVPLTITEFPPLQPTRFVDDKTYSLLKQPADFPVTSFHADPVRLDDLGESITLYWTVSDQGKQDLYGLRIVRVGAPTSDPPTALDEDPVAPAGTVAAALRDCVSDGVCYTWQDGQNGVPVSSVNQTTTFALDIVSADSAGHRTVVGTLRTTVEVTVPWISQNSYLKASPSGTFVWLHWLAFNARSCSLLLDGDVIDAEAPTDTYRHGYLLMPPDSPSQHQVSVVAHAVSGNAQASFPFPLFRMHPRTNIQIGQVPRAIAFTPDSSLALVTDLAASSVTVIDTATLKAEPKTIPVGKQPEAIAVSPDGALAFTADTDNQTVTVIDVATRTPEADKISIPGMPDGVAVTPDGSLLLVSVSKRNVVAIVDVKTRTVQESIAIGGVPNDIAITADSALAFIANAADGTVTVLDIPGRRVKAPPISVGGSPTGVALTPDGSLVLVTSLVTHTVSFVDVRSLAVVATLKTAQDPTSPGITPDGSRALVATSAAPGLTVIDIRKRTSVSLSTGLWTWQVKMAPNGSLVLSTGWFDSHVTVL
jgi:YVTN family beta-propeller protein